MRGLPGSGKSYYVKKNFKNSGVDCKIVSTDDHFVVNGVYTFDPAKLPEYHNRTLLDFIKFVQNDEEFIVVDNTNVKIFEISPFYRIAEAFGYEVEIVHVVADPKTCKQTNTHKVPPHVIDNMVNSFEPIPFWWKQTIFINN